MSENVGIILREFVEVYEVLLIGGVVLLLQGKKGLIMTLHQEQNVKCMIGLQGNVNMSWQYWP